MTEPMLRKAAPDDAARLGAVAPAAYVETYSYLWDDPAALAEHLQTFGESAWREKLADPQLRIWIASAGDYPVGFLMMKMNSADPVTNEPGGAELQRIYLLSAARGKQLGRRLFEKAREEAQREKAAYIWLDVMTSAPWAQRSYQRWGFVEAGRDRFPKAVKDGMAEMIVLRKTL